MISYKDIAISVNGTGIFARSASFNSSPQINQSVFGGALLASAYKTNALSSTVNLEYLTRLTKDPFLNNVISFKNNANSGFLSNSPYHFEVKIGNTSGSFYLGSLALNLEDNSLISASVSLISFTPSSGNGAYPVADNIETGYLDFSHSNNLNFTNDLNSLYEGNIYGFSYSYQNEIFPIYKLGSNIPKQVILMGGSEKSSLQFDSFQQVNETGKYIEEYLNGYSNLILEPLYIYSGSTNDKRINLSLKDQTVISASTSVEVGSPIRTVLEAKRDF